jgi:leucyl aminopeptidase
MEPALLHSGGIQPLPGDPIPMLDVAFAKPALPRAGALALLVGEGETVYGLWREADEVTGGAVSRALEVASFKGAKGKTSTVLAPGAGLSRIVVVGLGKTGELSEFAFQEAGGHAAAHLSDDTDAAISCLDVTAAQAASVALGAVLRSYRFDRYRTKEKPEDKPRLAKLTILTGDPTRAAAEWARLKSVAEGVFFSRDLVSEPPNILNPVEMARRCEDLGRLGLGIEVLGPAEMQKLGFGAILGVAQGSANEPRVVIMRWDGAPGETTSDATKPLAFIGKGVTFDTGGISIKPAAGMEDMKWDMAGAGVTAGLMAALAGRKARVNAVGIIGLVENMPSGSAQRPGDVVKSHSGQTIEVINTDAEGRLVLADLLWYCQERFDPRFMVDLATLTGAIIIGLGHEHAGLFTNNDALAEELLTSGRNSGEKLWRMPLHDAYDKQLRSEIADMKNVGGRPAGASTAAHFLQRFVNNKPWAHLDIAGTAWATKDSACTPKGATAFGVRLLDQLVRDHYEV